jgi:hypothetical protein
MTIGKGHEKHVTNGTILDLHSFKANFQGSYVICGVLILALRWTKHKCCD